MSVFLLAPSCLEEWPSLPLPFGLSFSLSPLPLPPEVPPLLLSSSPLSLLSSLPELLSSLLPLLQIEVKN